MKTAYIVTGICMEGKNILHGDIVIVDTDKRPRPNKEDVCLCVPLYGIQAETIIKVYDGKFGPVHSVSCRYENKQMQPAYFVKEILGVVCEVWRDGECVQQIDVSQLPDTLPERSTITGDVCWTGLHQEVMV